MLLPAFWGKGIASQIAQQLIQRASQQPQLARLTAIIDPRHLASRQILSNNGFESESLKDYEGLPAEILQLSLQQQKA